MAFEILIAMKVKQCLAFLFQYDSTLMERIFGKNFQQNEWVDWREIVPNWLKDSLMSSNETNSINLFH